jgi:HSP20 family protein
MNQLARHDPLDDFFRGFFVRPVDFATPAEAPTIKVDVKEQEKQFVIHAELPGVKKEDIHVHVDGSLVSISAERRENKDVKEGERVLRTERTFGKATRNFQLGQDIDESAANAKFTDGVLELVLPKKAAVQAKRLSID